MADENVNMRTLISITPAPKGQEDKGKRWANFVIIKPGEEPRVYTGYGPTNRDAFFNAAADVPELKE